MKGRPRKSSTKLKLTGAFERNPDRRRQDAKVAEGLPKPPKRMSREARAEWRRVAPPLHEAGILSLVDRALLTTYCEAWSAYRTADKDLAKSGTLYLNPITQTLVVHPTVRILAQERTAMLKAASELGVTPVARARLAQPVERGDTLEELIG